MHKVTFLNTSMNEVAQLFRGTRKMLQPLDIMYAINTLDPERYECKFIEQAYNNLVHFDVSQDEVFVISTTTSYLQWNNHYLSLKNVERVLERLEELRPDRDYKLVLFGPHCINHYTTLLDKGADAVIVGEAELTVAAVVDTLLQGGSLDQIANVATADKLNRGLLPNTQQIKMSELPVPNWEICRDFDYSAHNSPKVFERGFLYETSRGCPFQCSYCNTETHRRTYRTKPIEQILRDLEVMVYEYGAEYVYFIDESFGYDNDWVDQLLPVLEKLPLQWGCQGNIKFTTPEKLEKMAKAGCISMEFGLESFNYEILKFSRKVNDLDRVTDLINSAVRVGISPLLFLLIGLPNETEETIRNTVEFMKTLDEGFRFSIGVPTPFPNTEYYRLGVKEELIKPDVIDERLYELSGMIGNDLVWKREEMDRFLATFGPNVWGTEHNVLRLEREIFTCFESEKEQVTS